jgi:hypothetical protein
VPNLKAVVCGAGLPLARRPSVTWIAVKRDDFAFTVGDSVRFRSSPSVVRTFCEKCGTPLTYQHGDSPSTIDVTTATLDGPEEFSPTREIWLRHRLAWEPLDENLERYQKGSSETSD